MSTELQDDKSPSELAALWKTIPKANIVEHRLEYFPSKVCVLTLLSYSREYIPKTFIFIVSLLLLAQLSQTPTCFTIFSRANRVRPLRLVSFLSPHLSSSWVFFFGLFVVLRCFFFNKDISVT